LRQTLCNVKEKYVGKKGLKVVLKKGFEKDVKKLKKCLDILKLK
jgi:hypothetical protein